MTLVGANKPGGMFAFGSSSLSASSNSTFSLNPTTEKKEDAEASKVEDKKESNTDKAPLTSAMANPLPLPKSNKWNCS